MKDIKTIGILGGVGPEATAELFKRIVRRTPAKNDQQHIPIIVINNPQIPDRTKAILGEGESPISDLINTAKKLEANNVDYILLPCNTAHYFIDDIQKEIKTPIINMVEETVSFITKNYPSVKKIGMISTTGTIKTKIYHNAFEKKGIKVIIPDEIIQESVVMNSIYGEQGIKAGDHEKPKEKIEQIGKLLAGKGAEIILAGCTEISLVLKQKNVPYVVIDPLTILAETGIAKAINIELPLSINLEKMEKETNMVRN